MQKIVLLGGRELPYELEYKSVKHINLRIRPDGTIHVSANRRHSMKSIEAVFTANADMILRSLDRAAELRKNAASITELSRTKEGRACELAVSGALRRFYPFFASACGGSMPEIRYRRMKSRWGSCTPSKKLLTFNTRLAYVPERCVEYVVVHEFCHFLVPNHSARFYQCMASVLPDWHARRDEIRKYEGIMT